MAVNVVPGGTAGAAEIRKMNSKPLEAADLKKFDRHEKEATLGTHQTIKDIRVQLNEQLKGLDGRLDTQQAIVNEVQDFFKRKAEIEVGYSRELDKLAKYVNNRHKEQKQRRDGWYLHSSSQVWELLVAQTKKSARDHHALADIYTSQVVSRCQQIGEDLQNTYRKCREIGYEIHEEVLKVLYELHTAMKTHHTYQSEFRLAESKLQIVDKQRHKVQQSVPIEKRDKHRKLKLLVKEYYKRKQKFDESRLKATKARNEYLLCMEAANSSVQKYFVDDLSDLIDCMDFGFHQSLTRAILSHSSGIEQVKRSLQTQIDQIGKNLAAMDSRLDKQKFIESNNITFMIPKKFEYAPVRRDESEIIVQKVILNELDSRKGKLVERLTQLKTESEEIWKSMDSAEKSLSEIFNCQDYDTTRFFVEEEKSLLRQQQHGDQIGLKQKADEREYEEFYMEKFREYVLNSNRIARLQAKYDRIRAILGDKSSQPVEGTLTLTRRPHVARRRRIGNKSRQGQPKLFGGSLEEYLEETNQDIPIVIRSCVRVINLFGLHHQGIFRVSGSQVEINNFRDAFERGEDPLADTSDASDINSVAGVMKLYLRELREPVFPIQYFDHFMDLAKLESKHEFVLKVRDVVKNWPRTVSVVMRYIFAFLHHLSEFSDENMMDPYNLAICFGPTLVPIPEDRDQVQFQNLVNELIKNFIIFHEDIFPLSIPGPIYEKYLTNEPEEMGDSPADQVGTDMESEVDGGDDDCAFVSSETMATNETDTKDLSLDLFGRSESIEAQALYDFKARSSREVNFRRGDTIQLYKQVSNDWWRGAVNGEEGLIPDKYIMLKISGEDERGGERERDRLESSRSTDDYSLRDLNNSLSRSRTCSITSETSGIHSQSLGQHNERERQPSNSNSLTSQAKLSPLLHTRRGSHPPAGGSPSNDSGLSPLTNSALPSSPVSDMEALSLSDSRRTDADSLPDSEDASSPSSVQVSPVHLPASSSSSSGTVTATTHVIRVTGPVTNLDETVVSGGGADGSPILLQSAVERRRENQESMTLAPTDGARKTSSRESLLSTGSNQQLQRELNSDLAEVEALAQELEKRTSVPSTPTGGEHLWLPPHPSMSTSTPTHAGGAIPKTPRALPRRSSLRKNSVDERGKPVQAEKTNVDSGIVLRQSSWGSRENFLRPKENSANSSSSGEEPKSEPKSEGAGGFRSNRNFWETKVRQKQTPDLVLDLPVSNTKQPMPKPRALRPTSLAGLQEKESKVTKEGKK